MKRSSKKITIRLNDTGRKRLRMMLSAVLIVFSFYLLAGPILDLNSAPAAKTADFTAVSGDTQWNTVSNIETNKDIIEVISDICELNGIDSSALSESSVVYLPVYR